MADTETASGDVLRAALRALAAGPVPLGDLAGQLAAQGLLDHVAADPDAQIDELLSGLAYRDDVWISPDELVVLADHALRDVVFTHRVTASELEREMLDVAPDLDPLDHGRLLPLDLGGQPVERIYSDEDERAADTGSLVGPDGWLAAFAAGDLLAVRRRGEALEIERIAAPGDGTSEAQALRRAFDVRVAEPGIGQLVDTIVLDVLTDQPGLFTAPVRPISELLADVGLECQGEWTGPAGAEWVPPYLAARESELDILIERYALDECCLELLDRVMEGWNEFVLDPEAHDFPWADVGAALAHGSVAAAFADHILRSDDEPSPSFDVFARNLGAVRNTHTKAVAAFLLARNLEHGGDVTLAEAHLHESVHHDPEFAPALEDLAWYAADRGDAEQSVNLLRRAGVANDDPQVVLLESMRPRRNVVGRNERCPCGSGRKYKDCCQRNPVIALERRADWLEHKLWTFTLRPRRQLLPLALAVEMAIEDADEELDTILGIGFPMDLAAFELGFASDFLVERGVLLPDDERALLETWIEQPRRLYEIVERASSTSLVLRDLTTGDLVTVSGFDAERHDAGSLWYARIAPLGDTNRFVGVPVDVPAELRGSAEALLGTEPDAWAIARWLANAMLGPDVSED